MTSSWSIASWHAIAAERQASAGARDGVKGQGRTLAARAPLHALVRPLRGPWLLLGFPYRAVRIVDFSDNDIDAMRAA